MPITKSPRSSRKPVPVALRWFRHITDPTRVRETTAAELRADGVAGEWRVMVPQPSAAEQARMRAAPPAQLTRAEVRHAVTIGAGIETWGPSARRSVFAAVMMMLPELAASGGWIAACEILAAQERLEALAYGPATHRERLALLAAVAGPANLTEPASLQTVAVAHALVSVATTTAEQPADDEEIAHELATTRLLEVLDRAPSAQQAA